MFVMKTDQNRDTDTGSVMESLRGEFPDIDITTLEVALHEAKAANGTPDAEEIRRRVRQLVKLRRDDPNTEAAIRL